MKRFFLIVLFLSVFSSLHATLSDEPWLQPPAIRFLETYLKENPEAIILEFGSGGSTVWFAKRTPKVTSIEHDQTWFERVSKALKRKHLKADLRLLPRPYYTVCESFPDNHFDLILVDGRNRKGCVVHALPKLKSGGILMLDDAQRSYYHSVFPLMQGWGHTIGYKYPNVKTRTRTDWWIKP